MKRLFCTLLVIVATAVWLLSCDDDCPTCPKPPAEPDYQLLYSYVGQYPDTYVLTYSTKSGEIVDSALYQGNPFDAMVFSHDGQYACYTSHYDLELGASETWVTRWATGDTVAYQKGIGAGAAYLSEDDQFLLLSLGEIIAILRFPNLETVFLDSISSGGGSLHPTLQIAYVGMQTSMDTIVVLNYAGDPIETSYIRLSDSHGNRVFASGPFLCTNELLFVNSFIPSVVSYLQIYDVNTFGLIREYVARMYSGGSLHEDGKRLYLSHIAFIGSFPVSGGIDLYNLETNTFQPWIAEGEIDLGTGEPFVPNQVEFTPDGESMFVLSGGNGFWLGPVLQLSTRTKEVIQRFDNSDGFSRLIRLNPKNVAN